MVKGGDGACLRMRCCGRATDDAVILGVRNRGAMARKMPLLRSEARALGLEELEAPKARPLGNKIQA